jgi:hypothetical protein
MENIVERIKTLMQINENIDVKLKRRYTIIKNLVESFLYESEGAIDGLVESSDDEFEFADQIIEMVAEQFIISEGDDWIETDNYIALSDYIKENFGFDIIEYYFDNKEMDFDEL